MRLWIPVDRGTARCAMFDLTVTFSLWEDGTTGWAVSSSNGKYAAQGDTPAEAMDAFALCMTQTRALHEHFGEDDPFFPPREEKQ